MKKKKKSRWTLLHLGGSLLHNQRLSAMVVDYTVKARHWLAAQFLPLPEIRIRSIAHNLSSFLPSTTPLSATRSAPGGCMKPRPLPPLIGCLIPTHFVLWIPYASCRDTQAHE